MPLQSYFLIKPHGKAVLQAVRTSLPPRPLAAPAALVAPSNVSAHPLQALCLLKEDACPADTLPTAPTLHGVLVMLQSAFEPGQTQQHAGTHSPNQCSTVATSRVGIVMLFPRGPCPVVMCWSGSLHLGGITLCVGESSAAIRVVTRKGSLTQCCASLAAVLHRYRWATRVRVGSTDSHLKDLV